MSVAEAVFVFIGVTAVLTHAVALALRFVRIIRQRRTRVRTTVFTPGYGRPAGQDLSLTLMAVTEAVFVFVGVTAVIAYAEALALRFIRIVRQRWACIRRTTVRAGIRTRVRWTTTGTEIRSAVRVSEH